MEATEKQRDFLAKLASKDRCVNEHLDAAAEKLGFDHWDEAPITKQTASAAISVFLGKADTGLWVWAVKQELAS